MLQLGKIMSGLTQKRRWLIWLIWLMVQVEISG